MSSSLTPVSCKCSVAQYGMLHIFLDSPPARMPRPTICPSLFALINRKGHPCGKFANHTPIHDHETKNPARERHSRSCHMFSNSAISGSPPIFTTILILYEINSKLRFHPLPVAMSDQSKPYRANLHDAACQSHKNHHRSHQLKQHLRYNLPSRHYFPHMY